MNLTYFKPKSCEIPFMYDGVELIYCWGKLEGRTVECVMNTTTNELAPYFAWQPYMDARHAEALREQYPKDYPSVELPDIEQYFFS